MPRLVAAQDVDTVVRGLIGVIDVDDGPSDEQLGVLGATCSSVTTSSSSASSLSDRRRLPVVSPTPPRAAGSVS